MANSAVLGASRRARQAPLPAPRTPTGLLLRLRTWIARPWLDRAIVRGVNRPGDRALELRQAQLVGRPQRTRLALWLEDVLTAHSRPTAPTSAAPVDLEAVEVARSILTEVVLSLRSSEAVDARGVVLGRRLLTDPVSPVYATPNGRRARVERLRYAALSVLLALGPVALDGLPGLS